MNERQGGNNNEETRGNVQDGFNFDGINVRWSSASCFNLLFQLQSDLSDVLISSAILDDFLKDFGEARQGGPFRNHSIVCNLVGRHADAAVGAQADRLGLLQTDNKRLPFPGSPRHQGGFAVGWLRASVHEQVAHLEPRVQTSIVPRIVGIVPPNVLCAGAVETRQHNRTQCE
jgi:hypothetical protein